ncbi:MAG: MFS transporter [Betaproteobacteria bacterium]|nr:MFS transporter [Betaproteobacteria bacterium]
MARVGREGQTGLSNDARPEQRVFRTQYLATLFLPFAAGFFLSFIFRNTNAVISKDLRLELNLTAADLGLLTSAYFLAFALMQIPVGVLLDRYGPRKVVVSLLVVAAFGALAFAQAETLTTLTVARALIGVGVSACLMGAFKAFALWFPQDRIATANGWVIAAGGLGALTATIPLEVVTQRFGWRMMFVGLAGMAVVIGIWILTVVPEKSAVTKREDWMEQISKVGAILSTRMFWQIGLPMATVQAVYQANFGLWLVPWLMDTNGLDRATAAQWLFWMALASTIGSIAYGSGADQFAKRGISRLAIYRLGTSLAIVGYFASLIDIPGRLPILIVYAFGAIAPTLAYTLLTQRFPPEMSGRVTTAVNMTMFAAVFAAQWGVGTMLRFFPFADGRYSATAYVTAFTVLGIFQLIALAWLLCPDRTKR